MQSRTDQVEVAGASEAVGLEQLVGLYLSFRLSKETYGINILRVVEIISLIEITPVPNSPQFVKGIINLRGQIIPVVDLRSKFGIPEAQASRETCVIVVNVAVEHGEIQVGLLVDAVKEVVDISLSQIANAPKYGSELDTSFISAMARLQDSSVLVLVDVERALKNDAGLLAAVG